MLIQTEITMFMSDAPTDEDDDHVNANKKN